MASSEITFSVTYPRIESFPDQAALDRRNKQFKRLVEQMIRSHMAQAYRNKKPQPRTYTEGEILDELNKH